MPSAGRAYFHRSAGLYWRVVGGTLETSEQKDPSDPHDKDTVTTFVDRAPDTHARHCGWAIAELSVI